MQVLMALIRTSVLLLLTLRVLATPLAMRPESPSAVTKYRLVARVCAWPALRPERSISATSLGLRPRHRGGDDGRDPGLAPGSWAQPWLPWATASRRIDPASSGLPSRQLSVCRRC